MSDTPLPRWSRLDSLRVNPHQAIVDKLNQQGLILGDGGGRPDLFGLPGGQHLRIQDSVELWQAYGVISELGGSGTSPLTLEQYYVKFGDFITRDLTGSGDSSTRVRFYPTGSSGSGSGDEIVVATNLMEMSRFRYNERLGSGSGSSGADKSGSHGVLPGQQVLVTATGLKLLNSVIIIYTFANPPTSLPVRLDSMTVVDGRSQFSWKEQRLQKSGQFEEELGGLTQASFSTAAYAYPVSSRQFATGDYVFVRGWTENTGAQEFVIQDNVGIARLVKVLTALDGGGKYSGKICQTPTSSSSTSDDLISDDMGALGDTSIYVYNGAEVGQSSHDITEGSPKSLIFPAIFIGAHSDGTLIYGINGYDWENCGDEDGG